MIVRRAVGISAALLGTHQVRLYHDNALSKEHRAELHEKVANWLSERARDRAREYEDLVAATLPFPFVPAM